MKKKKLMLTGLVGFAFLFGCNQIDNGEVKAGLPESFKVVAETEVGGDTYYEVKHVVNGCHYVFVNGYQAVSITQMFIEKDGVSVPYCDK